MAESDRNAEPEIHQDLLSLVHQESVDSLESGLGSQGRSLSDSWIFDTSTNSSFLDSQVLESLDGKLLRALHPSGYSVQSIDSGLGSSQRSLNFPNSPRSSASSLQNPRVARRNASAGAQLFLHSDSSKTFVANNPPSVPCPRVTLSDYDKQQQQPTMPEPVATQSGISRDKAGVSNGIQRSPPTRHLKRHTASSNLPALTLAFEKQLGQTSSQGSESDNESTSADGYFSCVSTPTESALLESSMGRKELSGIACLNPPSTSPFSTLRSRSMSAGETDRDSEDPSPTEPENRRFLVQKVSKNEQGMRRHLTEPLGSCIYEKKQLPYRLIAIENVDELKHRRRHTSATTQGESTVLHQRSSESPSTNRTRKINSDKTVPSVKEEEFTICGMELDDRELYDLAEHISSGDVQHLAVELHGTVKGYRQIEHGCRVRSSSLKDCVFEVLKRWHENQTTSPQECRKTLVQTLHRLDKCQLAAAVVSKDYTRLDCPK